MIPVTIPLPSKEAIEQCRSSPAAAFIREYSGQCRFTPNPDYIGVDFASDPSAEQTITIIRHENKLTD